LSVFSVKTRVNFREAIARLVVDIKRRRFVLTLVIGKLFAIFLLTLRLFPLSQAARLRLSQRVINFDK
jgi:hypothetical protein